MKSTRIAIIGSKGQLGTDLMKVFKADDTFAVLGLDHQAIECTEISSVRSALKRVTPEVVINCAAYVRVDDAEDEAETALKVNTLGALNVARTCSELSSLCVYISTDFVFDGEKGKPYLETDRPNPINAYGVSKLAGEHMVSAESKEWLIIRLASLFGKAGARGKGGNFVETILAKARAGDALKIINDIRMSPTYSYDAALTIRHLINRNARGIVHAANDGSCSWLEFAHEIVRLGGLKVNLEGIESSSYGFRARRPQNSSLTSSNLDSEEQRLMQPWRKALQAYMNG